MKKEDIIECIDYFFKRYEEISISKEEKADEWVDDVILSATARSYNWSLGRGDLYSSTPLEDALEIARRLNFKGQNYIRTINGKTMFHIDILDAVEDYEKK